MAPALERIRLPSGVWSYDPNRPLGPRGGFGQVYAGADEEGRPVAVKRLHIDAAQAAHRELRIAMDLASRKLRHVIPVLDAGQDAESDRYFVVMPVAEESLQSRLQTSGPMEETAAADVLLHIVSGLEEVEDIVHRDLKPANVLLLESRWSIADFGIARFVEDSTSLETLKDCLSPPYAAPEQWRYEHATSATDIYALGCIGHALLTGSPPFAGTTAELKDSHLHAVPQDPSGVSSRMQTLLAMMLRKSPDARPTVGRVRTILEQIRRPQNDNSTSPALGRLAAAAAAHEREQARADAERQEAMAVVMRRNALASEAQGILVLLFDQLARQVTESVPTATVRKTRTSFVIQVASATLEIGLDTSTIALEENAFPRSQWDVICGAIIEAVQEKPRHKRSASLWYTRRADKKGIYRWLEVGYEGNPLARQGFEFEPAAVTPELADRAHSNAMDVIQTSYPPIPIDDEDTDAFCQRWLYIVAEAAAGKLQNLPRSLPNVP